MTYSSPNRPIKKVVFHDDDWGIDNQPLSTPMDREWCKELVGWHVVTEKSEASQLNGLEAMHTLYLPQALEVVRACLDDRNPTMQSAALAKRDDWLLEFELKTLHPGPGVLEALEKLKDVSPSTDGP